MQPTSVMCRAQEAQQQALADASPLENVRRVSLLAAAAWAKEAVAAEKREERKMRRQADTPFALPLPSDASASENPDRGHADLGVCAN